MLIQPELNKKQSYYSTNTSTKKYDFAIPHMDSKMNIFNQYHDKINNLVLHFDQNNISSYDAYLINDALGVSNSKKNHIQQSTA